MVAYTLSFVDRQILSLLVVPIKAEFGISDTAIGLLQGLAFALFYTFLGLPMGRIVDRYRRIGVIVIGVSLWSIMTVFCGIARTYTVLFLARMGVGVGEATLSPGALSILTDYFPKERLGVALSVYSMGIFIGSGLAFIAGGAVVEAVASVPAVTIVLLGELASWRLVFFIVGVPGVLVALLIATLREPVRTGVSRRHDGELLHLSVKDVAHELDRRRGSIGGICAGMACHAISMYGLFAWGPTFLIREFGWSAGQAGVGLGSIVLVAGCGGMYWGGRLCDRWQSSGQREAPLRVGVWSGFGASIAAVLAFSASEPLFAIALIAPLVFGLACPIGSMFAALQLLVPNQVRGQLQALYLFVISLVGITLGPLLPGLLTDYLFADPMRIGSALAMSVGISLVGMALFFRMTFSSYRANYAAMHG